MPKQLNIRLGFEADTKQAQQQIAQLQKSLDGLLNSSIKQGSLNGFNSDIAKAQQSILQLKTALNNSLNADTGRLDLSKFNGQLNSSGLTLSSLSKDMSALGTDGQKAFLNLANSIVTAQKPMVESNKLLDGMWTALKNTARWQMSSSILHGLVGALEGAYGYAQDLNKSLTDIAIVTGRSTDQMAAFAEQANRSAQALSVSTTAYTDAALIYYQQGLDDEAVKARTDITMQMSNVTGESAEHVSSYMTAIWNNFAEGSENLEHYADVITALGAATASSSEEIANGMQQFAAVADTVGLSYEYAATALATVVAQTRQSESTVGNSFRTIFSRLQGLKLGETLEDGTDLNKYSKALATVGVNIKDQNGELKDMDTILDEIGAKWQTLAKDQQIALAQTVGGVRQYTNLVALFDNWDTFQENLNVANTSDGALQKQADIYAESWEAAQKRVKAAWQAIYQDLIDDKFFIGILNVIEKILQGIDGFIDSIGGLKGVLTGLGIIFTSVFEKQMVAGLQNAQQQLKVFSGTAQAENDAMAAWVKQNLEKQRPENDIQDQTIESLEIESTKQRLALTIELKNVYDNLSLSQKDFANNLLSSVEAQQKLTIEAKKTEEAMREQANISMRALRNSITTHGADKELTSFLAGANVEGINFEEQITKMSQLKEGTTEFENAYQDLYETMVVFSNGSEKQIGLIENFIDAQLKAAIASNNFKKAQEASDEATLNYSKRIQELVNNHHNGYLSTNELIKALKDERENANLTEEEIKKLGQEIEKLENSNQGVFGAEFAKSIVNSARAISQFSMGINSLSTAWNTIKNPDISGWQKLTSVITSLSFGIPALISGFKGLGGIKTILNGLSNISNIFTVGIKAAAVEHTQKLAIANAEAAISQIELTKAQRVGALVLEGYDINTAENIVNTEILSHEKDILVAKEQLLKVGLEGTNTAMLASKAVMWEIYLVIGLVVAALALWNKEEEKQKEAWNQINASMEDAKNRAQELVNAYDDLKNKLDEIASKKDTFKDLEKGSADYQAAIAAVNAEMLKLIEQYDLIEGKDFTFNSNGMIEWIDGEGVGVNKVKQSALQEQRTGYALTAARAMTHDANGSIARNQADKIISGSFKTDNINDPDGTKYIASYRKLFEEDTLKALNGINLNDFNEVSNLLKYRFGPGLSDCAAEFANIISSSSELQSNFKTLGDTATENVAAQNAAIKASLYANLPEENLKNYQANYLSSLIQDRYDEFYGRIGQVTSEDKAAYAKSVDSDAHWDAEEEKWIDSRGQEIAISDELVKSYIAMNKAINMVTENYSKNSDYFEEGAKDLAKKQFFDNLGVSIGNEDNAEVKSQWLDDGTTRNNLNTLFDSATSEEIEVLIDFKRENGETPEEYFNRLYEELQSESHNITINVKADLLSNYSGKDEDLMEEVKSLGSFIQSHLDDYEDLSKHLANCADEANAVAWALIRFDDAVQDVSNNYESWMEALNNGSIIEKKEAVDDLRKAYANLLDLDGSKLTDDFLEDTQNLEWMNEAINGNIDSYQNLQDAMAKDLIMNVYFAGNDTAANDAMQLYWDLQSYFDENQLTVGATIDDANLITEMNDFINTLGVGAEEAKAALAEAYNVDAEIEEITIPEGRSYDTYTNAIAQVDSQSVPTPTAIDVSGSLAGAIVSGGSTEVPSIQYELSKEQIEKTAGESTQRILRIKDAHKGAGGGFKINHRTVPSSGKKGSSCFIAGTQISLNNSYKNIEDIKPGDIVLSYNEKKKKNVFNEVLQTMIHFVHEKIYSLFIKDEQIKATGNHKFLVIHNDNQEWMEVSDIQIGDLVLFSNGTWHEISDIDYEVKHETVYNFEVSDTHNYYVGKNQVLAHNKGGGGGGKSSAPKKQKREKPVQEKDRYHDLKEKIKDLTTETSRLEKISSRVWGKEKLKYMDQEIKKQEQQIGLTKEYIKEAKNYLAEDKKRLDEIKMGAKYVKDDNTGEWLLTNYEEVLQNIVDAQNKAVDAFNDAKGRYENGEISEDELKAQEEAFNLDKEKFEERKKILKQYEDTYNTVQEQMEKLIDDQWKLYDLKLEKVKVEVELELKVSDQSKKILEWSFKYLGNDLDAVSDKVANLSSQMNYLAGDLETVQNGISGIFANHGINFNWDKDTPVDKIISDLKSQVGGSVYSELTEAEVDALMEYMNKLMEIHDSAADKMKEVLETFSAAVEKANEKLERQFDRFDKLKSTLTTYKDIVDLTGKNILKITSKNLEDLNKVMIQNDQNKLMSARAIYETNKGIYEATRAELNTYMAEGNAQLVEQLQEQLNGLEDTMNESLESYRDALKETLEDVQQAWEDALDAMEEAYEKAFGNLGSTWYQEQFDRQKELNELYLPDYKKYHELNKSMTELQKNLANTNNQIVKGKAKELLEDINDKMKSGAQVSEYEAGIIERRVALLKAEDELLAARNAKSTVRMTRDNEGGFSYTYTADEDQINNAQQGYSDAYYELRDYQVTGANDLQSQWLQIQGEFAQRVRDIEEQYRDNEAARVEALKQLQAEYQTYVNYFSNQMGVVYRWEATLRDNDLKDLQKVTGLKLDEWNTYITSWNDTLLNTVIPGYDTYDQLLDTWDKAMNTAITSVNKAHNNYQKNVKVTMDNAGMSVSGFKEQFEKDMANVQIDSDNTTGNIKTLTETTMKNFKTALGDVSNFTNEYLIKFDKVRDDNLLTMDSIQKVINKLKGLNDNLDTADTKAKKFETETAMQIQKASENIAHSFDGIRDAANGAGEAIKGMTDRQHDFNEVLSKTPSSPSSNGYKGMVTKLLSGYEKDAQYDPTLGWYKIVQGATGMYTGDWHSSEGKLAILHEKELVLNKEDTKNMLDAVNVVRSMQTPINGLARNMFNYNSLNNVGSTDTLEQQVHIDATFPNVSDHNEIELALNNLVNSASQYVNRK